MIKRLIGFVVTLAVLAVVVITILHHGRYRSMLPFGDPGVTLVTQDSQRAPVPTQEAVGDTTVRSGSEAVPGTKSGVDSAAIPGDTPAEPSLSTDSLR